MNFEYWRKTKQIKPFTSIEELEAFESDLVKEMGDSGVQKPAAMRRPIAKKGMAFGIKYDSFSEFVFYTYMTRVKHALVERNYKEHCLLYFDSYGKQRKYYPDFVVDGALYEVKGQFREKDKLKKEQHPEVSWLFQDDIDRMAAELDEKLGRQWRSEFVQTNVTRAAN